MANLFLLDWNFSWLWESLVAQVIWVALAITAAFLRKKWPKIAELVLYGLATLALLLVVSATIKISAYIDQVRPTTSITPANVERVVKGWAESFNYGVRRPEEEAQLDCIFAFDLDTPNGKIAVVQQKTLSRYLLVTASLTLSKEHQEIFDKLSEEQRKDLLGDVKLEMIRLHIDIAAIKPPVRIILSKTIPIADTLTEYQFISTLLDVNAARQLAAEVITRKLRGK